MKELILKNEKKWTSRDLALWTNKQHKNVLRDIRNEIDSLSKTDEGQYFVGVNLEVVENTNVEGPISNTHYVMTKAGIQQMAMRYDAITRMRINKKIETLQEKSSVPKNYLEALKELVKKEEENTRLIEERDNAIATKAHVSKGREGTMFSELGAYARNAKKRKGEYHAVEIAQMLGIISKTGKPHAQLIGAIIKVRQDRDELSREVTIKENNTTWNERFYKKECIYWFF